MVAVARAPLGMVAKLQINQIGNCRNGALRSSGGEHRMLGGRTLVTVTPRPN